jgi:hypothetical protein
MTPIVADPWAAVAVARLPASRLDALAPVRGRPDVVIVPAGDSAWVRWTASHAEVIRCLLPVPDVELFTTRDGHWFRFGRRVPVADRPPEVEGRPVAGLLLPGPIVPTPPTTTPIEPVALALARSTDPKPVTALACELADLRGWADTATTAELGAVRGAVSGSRAILRGSKLPYVRGATRYWGESVLVPIGFRPDPDLPAGLIRAAVQAEDDELVLLGPAGAELVPVAVFEPLTRAGLRLALARGCDPSGVGHE